ncbi:MAG TPA: PQQ-binding-like beta-propeller repeat protein [Acidimicrobiia bacterium]|nr:PQQ-binding-like beta-propeller repeat protein [Acidimicrobiia bacterium]
MTHRPSASPPADRAARFRLVVLVLVLGIALVGAARFLTDSPTAPASAVVTTTSQASSTSPSVVPSATAPSTSVAIETTVTTGPPPTTLPDRESNVVPDWTVGRPWGEVTGLTMFRGNPTRSWYGTGPAPTSPSTLWSYPDSGGLCGSSSVGGETTTWCGSGWTGQPVVWERPDDITEVIFGAYDKSVHFLDADTGEPTRPSFPTGDIIKGSVSLDPDGFPLLYTGSRDNKLRAIALDRERPTELWSLDANVVNGIWNDDWDGNPVIVDDILYEGGENSWFFAVALNRGYDADGLVTIAPELLVAVPGYTDELVGQVGRNVSIESSVAVYEQRAYFVNSGGRVVGLDVSNVRSGEAPVVFDYWVGDDADATIVIDVEGMLYVSVEDERKNSRSAEVGQLVKLDPYTDGDARLWGVPMSGGEGDGGFWATPALGDGVIYNTSHIGRLIAVDTESGDVVWEDRDIAAHSWSSPAIVDGTLIAATCGGEIRGYSLADPRAPALEWTHQLSESCIESTPAVWNGRLYVGSRDGKFYAVGDG